MFAPVRPEPNEAVDYPPIVGAWSVPVLKSPFPPDGVDCAPAVEVAWFAGVVELLPEKREVLF